MRLTMQERKRVVEKTAGRYRQAGKKEKGTILNEFVALTGYTRSYARLVLRNHGRVVQVSSKLRVRGDVGQRAARGRRAYYDEKVVKLLVLVWRVMDHICGKRLAPVLGEMVELLEWRGELKCSAETKKEAASDERGDHRSFARPSCEVISRGELPLIGLTRNTLSVSMIKLLVVVNR
jgi:hypothetical protein